MPSFNEGVYTLMEFHLVNAVLDVSSEGSDAVDTFGRLLCEREAIEERAEQVREETDDGTYCAMAHEARVRCDALAGELLTLQGIER